MLRGHEGASIHWNSAEAIARRALQPHMFVDLRGRTGIGRPGIHYVAQLEHRKAICKSKYEGQMLLD